MDYVKFSRERLIMEGAPDRLRKELEEELKMSSEELRSHAWYHGNIPRQVAESLLQRDGDFLVRDSSSSCDGALVLSCQWRDAPQHFRISRRRVAPGDRHHFLLERQAPFDSVPALVRCYVGNRTPVSEVNGAIIFQPITRGLPLRCLEERYGGGAKERRGGQRAPAKRLSLNINANGHAPENSLGRGGLLRNTERCGSQPARLNQVQDRGCVLKTHQSESFLPLGSRPSGQPPSPAPLLPSPRSAVFRTGSEPTLTLSPPPPRRPPHPLPGHALRGSDSQLCPRPPPKPSKTPRAPPPLPSATPPAPPPKTHQAPPPASPEAGYGQLSPALRPHGGADRLRPEEGGGVRLDRSSYHHAIAALEDGSEEEEEEEEEEEGRDTDEREEEEEEEEEEQERPFLGPAVQTVSAFRPAELVSALLPAENKPLEMSVLRRTKQLLLAHTHLSIAAHMLLADCQVARILGVSEEVKGQMGVSSGLELVTLPHGRQLRLDLMERHHTMAIGVAVDILGCTGSVEERAETLNRIILVAMALKDTLGDLYAFSSVMKALDMPQITRLDHTWTLLRRKFTQTAIVYEKTLKPFYKGLYEGSVDLSQSSTAVPLLMPLLTLMERGGVACEGRGGVACEGRGGVACEEREGVACEGAEPWEGAEQGCDVTLRHLEAARRVAHNADAFASNARNALQGFSVEAELLEVFLTDFQLRVLWGSRGAAVGQAERYGKFTLILSALSRKLEPPTTHTLI